MCQSAMSNWFSAFCVTEDMVADLMTKIVSGAQEDGLFMRFYNDCVVD